MATGEYQSTSSTGFIFGIIIGPLLVLTSLAYLYWKGFKDNEQFRGGKTISSSNSLYILAWRVVVAIYAFFTIVYTLAIDGPISLTYFTVWNWTLVNVYFMIGCAVSIIAAYYPHKMYEGYTGRQSSLWRKLTTAHQLVGELEVPSSWLVAIVVWAYLAPYSGWTPLLNFPNIAMHATNAVIMTVDFVLSDYFFNIHHFALALFWPALYLIWHLIANATFGLMCYPFMETDHPSFIFWAIGIAAISVIFFFLGYAVSIWKKHGWSCKCCCAGPMEVEVCEEGTVKTENGDQVAVEMPERV